MTKETCIQVIVNGEQSQLPAGTTIAELVAKLAIKQRYAVEINQTIVPKQEHGHWILQPGDVLEVVQAIGGG